MISCSFENQSWSILESGGRDLVWRGDRSVANFIQASLPVRDHPGLHDVLAGNAQALLAVDLKKRAGLKFEGTDDLQNHLRLDSATGVVSIYHHTAVLKEQLLATKDPTKEHLIPIPRALALETLDTIQKLLFPHERQSQRFLRSLVSKQAMS